MRYMVTPAIIGFALLIVLLSMLYGCAAGPQAATYAPPALVTYSPEFAAKLALQLRSAPPELGVFAVDYIKLRCAIKPEMTVCADLLK